MYRIANSDLSGYSNSSTNLHYVEKVYERCKEYHLNKNSGLYGDLLVKDKRALSGFTIKFSLDFRYWIWKPEIRFKYDKRFHWLCFRFWFEKNHDWVFDKVIRDHLRESKNG